MMGFSRTTGPFVRTGPFVAVNPGELATRWELGLVLAAMEPIFDDAGALLRPELPPALLRGENAGAVSAVCVVSELRDDAGKVGVTAIDKRPVDGPWKVGKYGLYRDVQTDRANHGGLDRAVYALSQAEVEAWQVILGRAVPRGSFGENLRVDGPLDDLEIGAVVRIGGVELEATGPRNPCATFARWAGRDTMVKDFKFRGRGGVMFRVVKPGKLEAGDRLEIVSTPGHGVSVARWFTYEAPEDARVLLAAQEAGKVRIADAVMKYVSPAAARTL